MLCHRNSHCLPVLRAKIWNDTELWARKAMWHFFPSLLLIFFPLSSLRLSLSLSPRSHRHGEGCSLSGAVSNTDTSPYQWVRSRLITAESWQRLPRGHSYLRHTSVQAAPLPPSIFVSLHFTACLFLSKVNWLLAKCCESRMAYSSKLVHPKHGPKRSRLAGR